jgi:serine/threonine protein kinase
VDPISLEVEQAIFETALHIAGDDERRAFLDRACHGSPDLHTRLSALLEFAGPASEFFAASPLPLEGEEKSPPPPLEDSQVRIGRYRLLHRIGEGGYGVVYSAEQDGPVARQVALKIIRLGMDTERVIARFELERQALGMMDHPNIARVLDAGATANGRPFFVMELVSGVRITSYCDLHSLDTSARLALFMRVCSAIQHAHQKGIVHRDIKPSNVLVVLQEDLPVPKVIDFGIAKAVEGRLSNDRSSTVADQFIGTPAYMSPEQLRGGVDVDTRSDIYSLGALLHELLTGRPPFDTDALLRSGVEKMRRTLLETDPPTPSQALAALTAEEQHAVASRHRAEPARLIASLRGDLDWIVMKAMEKDRTRRYATVNSLAADIERYLQNQPVNARPPDQWYRFQKFVRRNRTYLAAATAVMLALAAGLGTSSYLFLREREARHVQAQLRADAEDRERIALAAVLVSQKRLEEADHLLDELHQYPSRPSLDGIGAFRWVAEWLALRGERKKAADRFFTVLRVNEYDDAEVVAMDYVSCGALYASIGDKEGYDRFRESTLASLPDAKIPNTLNRLLRVCLLRPPDAKAIARLRPLAEKAKSEVGGDDSRSLAVALALWHFRLGENEESARWSQLALEPEPANPSTGIMARTILAMAKSQMGKRREAVVLIDDCRAALRKKFAEPLKPGDQATGYWFDWVFAQALEQEAERLLDAGARD